MNQKLILIIVLFSIVGCKTHSNIGEYESSCKLYGRTELKLKVNNDGTFDYHFHYNEENVIGKWITINDTLILSSNQYLEKRDSLSPSIKNTDIDNVDKYLIKRNKLLVINKQGLNKSCYLIKPDSADLALLSSPSARVQSVRDSADLQSVLNKV